MNLNLLRPLNDYCWTLAEKSQIKLYGSKRLLISMDDKVLEQIQEVAALPGLVGSAMTMPDAHLGYGFPVGGVAAFDADAGGIISAGGVGFDISCGVRCLKTNLQWEDVLPLAEKLATRLYRTIPAGVGVEGPLKLSTSELDKLLRNGATWAVDQGFGTEQDLAFIEEHGKMCHAEPHHISDLAKQRQLTQMGTLGSGNHYLEIQVVDRIDDQEAASIYGLKPQQIIVMIHCGSRGLGHQICTDYQALFLHSAKKFGLVFPDPELASAPILSDEGQQYYGAMNAAINCALANRQILTHLTRECFREYFPGIEIETLYDVSHNTCKKENHLFQGKQKTLYVHRKGATRAFGPYHSDIPKPYQTVGQPVLIGGSMGTASYIMAGNSSEQNTAFASACHGAGRTMSRHQALKKWQGKELIKSLKERGILILTRSARGAAEEAPEAYKDIHEVALSTEMAGLARRVAMVKPKICVKG